MKEDNNKNNSADSRRKFLNKGLFASAGWLTGMVDIAKEETKKVKMLTPDGKLVEIDESIITNSRKRKKVKNQDILDWMEDSKEKKDIL